MLAEVIPEAKSYKSDCFSYSIPKILEPNIMIGSIVLVPFGKKNVRGVVRSIKNSETGINTQYTVKPIISIDNSLRVDPSFFEIIDWMANNYLCTQGEALSLFLPPTMKRPPKVCLNKNQANYVNHKKLSDVQNEIFQEIIKTGNKKPHLIHGVTGSGKTEIYIQLCLETIKKDKSCVVLVPEIILTPQNIERFKKVFKDDVSLIHSNLSRGEKYKAYFEFLNGARKVIIGPRSALLIPNPNIGIIIIDEEHEDSYKQDQAPRYHAVNLAEQMSKEMGAMLVLGSATPRIETFYKANSGRYMLHKLRTRFNKMLMPSSVIVDLKNEMKSNNFSPISNKMQEALNSVLKSKKQAILFLNRRGSSTFVSCRDCGEVINCPNCDIPLVHHINTNSYLYCHHCNYRSPVPSVCPACNGLKIKFFGAGVEKIEQEVKRLFPNAKIARVDAENIKNKTDYQKFYDDFKNHRFDIAIGTQMISKGFDMPDVNLVGIISADTGLHLPYFRASEKIFRLVTQVSGRSGRDKDIGQTIIQTYWPNSRAILAASQHDFNAFYETEIINRKKHGYPPFSHLIRVISEDEKQDKALKNIEKILPELENLNLQFIGPGLCFFQRLRNKWRYHTIIKLPNDLINYQESNNNHQTTSKSQKNNEKVIKLNTLRELWKNNLNLTWDVDPTDLL